MNQKSEPFSKEKKNRGIILLRVLTLLIFVLFASAAHAQTNRYVSPGGNDTANNCTSSTSPCATIGHAYSEANVGDTIDLAAGTYTESVTLSDDITIEGAGSDQTFVQAAATAGIASDRVFLVNSSSTITMSGVTIRFGNRPTGNGGGMEVVNNSEVILSDMIFKENTASASGGGLSVAVSSTATLTNILFEDNTASASDGGGMHNLDVATLTDVEFLNNDAGRYGGGFSGGVGSVSTLTNVQFYSNTAINGGGLTTDDSNSFTLKNGVISGNSSNISGGGVRMDNVSTALLSNVTISGNSSNIGGGMHILDSNPELLNMTINGNDSNGGGKAIYNADSSPTLKNVIIWDHDGSTTLFNFGTSNPSISYSLIEGSGGSGSWDSSFGTDGGNSIDTDPLFVTGTNPANAPTTTGDHQLMASSPAINTGDPSIDLSDFPGGPGSPVDLADNERVYDGTTDIIDIGAYEFQGDYVEPFTPFITTWEVTAGDPDITIPTTGSGYNYDVDWGDGNSDTGVTGDATHTYASAGTYTVEITGDFPQVYFNDGGDKEKIMTIEQWGDIEWASMVNAFYGASSLTYNATDAPDLTNVTHITNMFRGASSFNGDIDGWNLSNVTSASTVFQDATSFNQDLNNWDVSGITNMGSMFEGANSFNGNISDWDVSNVTNFAGLFRKASAFNQDISGWVTSSATTMLSMFNDASSFNQDISGWDVSDATNMILMLRDATAFDQDLGGWDITSVTNMDNMLNNSGMSVANYDATISGWEAQAVQNNITLGADGLEYCNSATERQALIDDHNWTISGDSEASDCSQSVALEAPTLTSPSDEAIDIGLPVTLDWNTVDDATSYQVQVVEESGSFGTPDFDDETSDTDIEVTGLSESTEYKWRVRSLTSDDESEWSSEWAFTTSAGEEELGVPQLASPSDEATNIDLTVTLDWDAASDAESYRVQLVEESGSFDTPNFESEPSDTDTSIGLEPLIEYKWRVRSLAGDDESEWSDVWTFTTRGLPEGEDQRILVSNAEDYTFSKNDFGISNDDSFIEIETLPDEGTLLFEDNPVNLDDEISIEDINAEDFTWEFPNDDYGYNFTSFDFRIVDDNENQSENPYTLTIDLGATSVEFSGSEGWRFMSNPSDGDSYNDLFSGITFETGSDPSQTLFELNQQNYEWDPIGSTSEEPGVGTPFIIYVLGDDLPAAIEAGDKWNELDGSFSYSGLDYDPSEPNPDSFFLLGNPHSIALDFCEFTGSHIATSVYFWNADANGGNGDYLSLNCAVPEDVLIAPIQSFWVRTTDTNPMLDIPMGAYLENTTDGYFKEKSEQKERFLITLTVGGEKGLFTNRAQILFSEDAKEGLDRFDAPKLSVEGLASQWLSFHSLGQDGMQYAFQSLPASNLANEKVRIPLDIETTESGPFKLYWNLPEPAVFSGSYFLRDNQTGDVIELRDGASYSFEISEDQTIQAKEVESTHPMSELAQNLISQSNTHLNIESKPRFELLIATSGIDGLTELGAVPDDFTLAQNYPNPFNPTTVINYQLPVSSEVRLEVYDMLGRNVATLVNEQVAAGRHTVNFDAGNLSSGVYLYRLQAGSQIMTKKLTILK